MNNSHSTQLIHSVYILSHSSPYIISHYVSSHSSDSFLSSSSSSSSFLLPAILSLVSSSFNQRGASNSTSDDKCVSIELHSMRYVFLPPPSENGFILLVSSSSASSSSLRALKTFLLGMRDILMTVLGANVFTASSASATSSSSSFSPSSSHFPLSSHLSISSSYSQLLEGICSMNSSSSPHRSSFFFKCPPRYNSSSTAFYSRSLMVLEYSSVGAIAESAILMIHETKREEKKERRVAVIESRISSKLTATLCQLLYSSSSSCVEKNSSLVPIFIEKEGIWRLAHFHPLQSMRTEKNNASSHITHFLVFITRMKYNEMEKNFSSSTYSSLLAAVKQWEEEFFLSLNPLFSASSVPVPVSVTSSVVSTSSPSPPVDYSLPSSFHLFPLSVYVADRSSSSPCPLRNFKFFSFSSSIAIEPLPPAHSAGDDSSLLNELIWHHFSSSPSDSVSYHCSPHFLFVSLCSSSHSLYCLYESHIAVESAKRWNELILKNLFQIHTELGEQKLG